MESELLIPKFQFNADKFKSCDTIFLIDYNADSIHDILYRFRFLSPFEIDCVKKSSNAEQSRIISEAKERISFVIYTNLGASSFKWDSFKFKMENVPSLYLEYDEFGLGKPKRDNFRICNLRKGVATEVKINGKKDTTLTGRRQRIYQETNIIFKYLGTTTRVKISEENFSKKIPSSRKKINLLKTLY